VTRAQTVIPGHGGPVDRQRALEILEEDAAYLDALTRDGAAAALPDGRKTAAQRRIHADNVTQTTS
jgi:hypothetical protein